LVEDGLDRLRAVVKANPRSTTFVALAHALCDAGLDEEAEEVSRRGLGQHPHLVTGQVALGRALFKRGRVREAQERLVEAAKTSPENGDAFRWLGEVVLRRGERDRARVLLEYAEELLPSDARVSDLLSEAGGVPQPRQSRPKTDFEDTRVSKNARALAERMQEEPPPRALHTPQNGSKATRGSRTSPSEDAITAEFEPRPSGKGATVETDAAIHDQFTRPDAKVGVPTTPPKPPRMGTAARTSEGEGQSFAARARAVVQGLWATRAGRFGAAGAVALVLAGSAWLLRPRRPEPTPFSAKWSEGEGGGEKRLVAAVDMTAAIAAGTLDGLQSVRMLGKRLAEAEPADPDQLAAAAFASALLANDYGVPGNGDALELAGAAARATPPRPFRTGLIEASRALAALSNGRLSEAEGAAKRAVAAAPDGAETRLVEARVQLRLGAMAEAEAALTKAVARTPVLTSAALDLAAARIDVGQAASAIEVLTALLARHDDLRGRLLLAEAERQLGKPPTTKSLRERCRDEGRASPILRTSCAADTAATARLAGDRAAATRAARNATAGAGRNPRALATGALILGNLGDVDPAADALKKIRDDTGPAFIPRVLAQLSVGLGRGEVPDAGLRVPPPPNPEARLLAARVAFARGGKSGLKDFVTGLPAGSLDQDPDLLAFAQLAETAPLEPKVQTALEERAEKVGGLPAYVLGRQALEAGEGKLAAQRLYRAATTTGETCEAARLLLTIDKKLRPPAVATDAKLAALSRSHGCASPLRP
jgi:tetratricopeptide (TPR) repeat protein